MNNGEHHFLDLTLDAASGLSAEARCTAPKGADCRLVCDVGCETFVIERDAAGNPWHIEDEAPLHRMHDAGHCNVVEYLNAEPADIPDLHQGAPVRISVAVTPVWEGDFYAWTARS